MSLTEEIPEAPDLDQRLEKLVEADQKILDVLTTVKEIFSGYDRDRQYARNKMEDLYKRYDKNIEDIHSTISEQLYYMENMCVGAEHQGSTFCIQQQSEMTKNRTDALRVELDRVGRLAEKYSTDATTHSSLDNTGTNKPPISTLKMLNDLELTASDEKAIKEAFESVATETV